ncbi:High-affinity glucose transporter [Fulvia fulva]|uniref:High-affinity glucose transporter n=1 Tax=Passalora fulva TaxID=5499 RepID=A0A9Q8LBG2_PASFU|nr:High-affinity glucose transporter [Fulvia fulva]KAK4631352.1 High-affinity glucose transporter [Fulvia fulva]KAK4633979.1 High-affinity glucose transporter [Fulvia fulva]UJO14184.1 High-affinity glucose transporter [Fulvia fulva]WPV10972.1 High-affinity glucose transporter [Fulvia fulva]WPV25790.1 High-affinity glucose transporter [Fulvia fulva]
MKKFGNVYLIAAISIIGGGLFGFDISSMSAIIATDPYLCYFNQGPKPCVGPTANVQGGITASMAGGSWLASLFSGFLSDALGRKRTIMIGAVIWVIGCIIVAAAQNIPMLIVGRIINGFCVGICSAQVPVYITEIAPPTKRGRLVGAQQWAITWGIMIMFYISYGCSFMKGTAAFRVPWALQMIPAIILFFGMIVLPESPRWLATKDKWEECEQVLILTHGHGDPNSPWWLEIERQSKQISYLELFSPKYINRTHIGLFTQIWSQLTGNALLVSSSIQYVINVVMTVPALIFIDRVGRRPLLLLGSTLMATWLFANAGILAVYGTDPGPNGVDNIKEASVKVSGAASKAVIACSYLFVASYAPTWGPVSWAVALATSVNWAFNFALGYFVPPAFINIKWQTYILFAVSCVAMTIHVFFIFPETAGKPLEEVTEMFEDPNGIPYLGTPAWKTKSNFQKAVALERGEGLSEKKLDDEHSPERHEVVETKLDV